MHDPGSATVDEREVTEELKRRRCLLVAGDERRQQRIAGRRRRLVERGDFEAFDLIAAIVVRIRAVVCVLFRHLLLYVVGWSALIVYSKDKKMREKDIAADFRDRSRTTKKHLSVYQVKNSRPVSFDDSHPNLE